jgi:hypothetical protein
MGLVEFRSGVFFFYLLCFWMGGKFYKESSWIKIKNEIKTHSRSIKMKPHLELATPFRKKGSKLLIKETYNFFKEINLTLMYHFLPLKSVDETSHQHHVCFYTVFFFIVMMLGDAVNFWLYFYWNERVFGVFSKFEIVILLSALCPPVCLSTLLLFMWLTDLGDL